MTEYWFKPKRYGYGATPITWQGWVLALAAPLSIMAAMVAMAVFGGGADAMNWLMVVAVAIAVVLATVVISYRKTDGEWRWRWGDDNH